MIDTLTKMQMPALNRAEQREKRDYIVYNYFRQLSEEQQRVSDERGRKLYELLRHMVRDNK